MARTIPTNAATEAAKVTGAGVSYILEVQWSGGTEYYSDRDMSVVGGDLVDAAGIVKSWGGVTIEAQPDQIGGHGSLSLDLVDVDQSLATLFDTEPGPTRVPAYVHLLFDGIVSLGDKVTLYGGTIGGGVSYDEATAIWKVALKGIEKSFDKSLGDILDRDNFPVLKCTEHEGEMIPIVYGEEIKRIPGKLIDAPGHCYLDAAADEHATSLTLTKTCAELGCTAATDTVLTVGHPQLWERMTGQFATSDSKVFVINTSLGVLQRSSIYAQGTSPGGYGYQGGSYLLVPTADLPGGASSPKMGNPVWIRTTPGTGSWSEAFVIDSWVVSGSNVGVLRAPIGVTFPAGAEYKIGSVPGFIVQWPSGTPVATEGDWVYAISHLPMAGVDSVEVRTRNKLANNGQRDDNLYFQLAPARYTTTLDNKTYNTQLGRGAGDPGITTITLAVPPVEFGFEDRVWANGDGPSTLQKPGEVLTHLLTNAALGGIPSANIADATFTAVDGSATVEVSMVVDKEEKLHQVASRIAYQCGCLYFWDQGKAHLQLLSNTLSGSVATINQSHMETGSFSIDHVDMEDVYTAARGEWKPTHESKSRKFYRESTDATTYYDENRKDIKFNYLQDPAHVADQLEFWLQYYLNRQRKVKFAVFLDKGLALQPGDVITVSYANGSGASILSSQLCRVTRTEMQFADADAHQMPSIQVEAEYTIWSYTIDTLTDPSVEEELCETDSPMTQPEVDGGVGTNNYGFVSNGREIGLLNNLGGSGQRFGPDGYDGLNSLGPCGCGDPIDVGTVDCLGTNDSPEVWVVSGLSDYLTELGFEDVPDTIECTFDADCEWISDDLTRTCGYGS